MMMKAVVICAVVCDVLLLFTAVMVLWCNKCCGKKDYLNELTGIRNVWADETNTDSDKYSVLIWLSDVRLLYVYPRVIPICNCAY